MLNVGCRNTSMVETMVTSRYNSVKINQLLFLWLMETLRSSLKQDESWQCDSKIPNHKPKEKKRFDHTNLYEKID